jgi:hypothetical protein
MHLHVVAAHRRGPQLVAAAPVLTSRPATAPFMEGRAVVQLVPLYLRPTQYDPGSRHRGAIEAATTGKR